MAIFVDSSVFCAYANSDDVHNKKAAIIIHDMLSNKYGNIITTDYVFDETVTVAMRRANKKIAGELGEFILNSEISIAKIDKLVFHKSWEIFQGSGAFSFTDCTIIAFMEIFGITNIATFDKEFKKLKNLKVVD